MTSAAVQQLPDGTAADEPCVCFGQYEYSLSDARLIAQALIAAADMGERMGAGDRRGRGLCLWALHRR
jgi:hypothetical protein